jgi:hypothetical protein
MPMHTIPLTKTMKEHLARPNTGQGGYQTLFRRMQKNATARLLHVSTEDARRILKAHHLYVDGGWPTRIAPLAEALQSKVPSKLLDVSYPIKGTRVDILMPTADLLEKRKLRQSFLLNIAQHLERGCACNLQPDTSKSEVIRNLLKPLGDLYGVSHLRHRLFVNGRHLTL